MFSKLDLLEILFQIGKVIFIYAYLKLTKILFLSLLLSFEENIEKSRIKSFFKPNLIFFIFSFTYITIGSLFFLYLALTMIHFINFEIIADNINLFICLNAITILYCAFKLFAYLAFDYMPKNDILSTDYNKDVDKLNRISNPNH
jgi:hypothetical protein